MGISVGVSSLGWEGHKVLKQCYSREMGLRKSWMVRQRGMMAMERIRLHQ